ncbi:MAG: hypothetical protein GX587_02735 [Bacteroidales bacterium]|nr:hypothetical protein [Bacteroidales bacterium]
MNIRSGEAKILPDSEYSKIVKSGKKKPSNDNELAKLLSGQKEEKVPSQMKLDGDPLQEFVL